MMRPPIKANPAWDMGMLKYEIESNLNELHSLAKEILNKAIKLTKTDKTKKGLENNALGLWNNLGESKSLILALIETAGFEKVHRYINSLSKEVDGVIKELSRMNDNTLTINLRQTWNKLMNNLIRIEEIKTGKGDEAEAVFEVFIKKS